MDLEKWISNIVQAEGTYHVSIASQVQAPPLIDRMEIFL